MRGLDKRRGRAAEAPSPARSLCTRAILESTWNGHISRPGSARCVDCESNDERAVSRSRSHLRPAPTSEFMRVATLAILFGHSASFVCPPPVTSHATRTGALQRLPGSVALVQPRSATPQALAPDYQETVSSEGEDTELDLGSVGRYIFAILIQLTLITTAFGAIDLVCYGPLPGHAELGMPLPWQAVVGLFLALSVRSRVFSPLDNSRPELRREPVSPEQDAELLAQLDKAKGKTRLNDLKAASEQRGLIVDATMDRPELERRLRRYFAASEARAAKAERLMPSWTPPGVTFPIMWVLVVAPLRAFAASLVYETSTGRLNESHLNDPVHARAVPLPPAPGSLSCSRAQPPACRTSDSPHRSQSQNQRLLIASDCWCCSCWSCTF